jgi:DnaJ-class molecular chaperone with C-terminal Zn finger domain
MKKYFANIKTLDELRKQYKELLKELHPDNNNGNQEECQKLNVEYKELFEKLKKGYENQENSNEYEKMKYDYKEDNELINILNKIINFDNIDIEICGQWIWVSGQTYTYKKELDKLGFKFAGKKKCWYWHTDTFRKKSRKALSMEEIRNYYGNSNIKKKGKFLTDKGLKKA